MRPIDADAMRNEWLENGENEYVYDTNAVLDSIDCQPTLTADDYFDAVDRIKPCPNCRYTLLGALTEDEPRWIPVTERLPEIVKTKRAWKNVYRRSGRVLCACLQEDGKRLVKEGYMEFFNDYPEPSWRIPGTIHSVTHWMPLPTPPKEEEND